jgi:cell division septal protein FtsQ
VKHRRNVLIAAGALLLLVGIVAGGRLIITRAPFFRVHAIEYAGLHYLDPAQLTAQLGLSTESHILADRTRIAARLAAIPGVRAVTVSRRWPATLRVSITEASPVAYAETGNRLIMVDATGKVLPYDPRRLPASLPIADRDSALTTLLARLATVDPVWYARIERATISEGDVILDSGDQLVRLRPSADLDLLHRLIGVRQFLIQEVISWRELDARFKGRVFVKRGNA